MEKTVGTFGCYPSNKTPDVLRMSGESRSLAQRYKNKGILMRRINDDLTREEEKQIKRAYGF
jgi:hypothetical protein